MFVMNLNNKGLNIPANFWFRQYYHFPSYLEHWFLRQNCMNGEQ
jgi:hypothetical protein